MRVCQIIGGDIKKVAGLEKHFIELCNSLASTTELSVIAHKSYEQHLSQKIKFYEINMNKGRLSLINFIKITKILQEENFDIIHTQANKATWILSKIKLLIKKSKFIATLHNVKRDLKPFEKVDCVIGVSSKILKNIKNRKKVIYNGLDIAKFQNIKKLDLQKEFHFKNSYPIAVCVGRYVKAKGMDLLIEAVRNLNINVLLIGDGPQKDELQKQIIKTDQKEKIYLTGFREDVKSLIKSADFAIIPSRNEGFSYVFAEVLILQTPLIATDVADIKLFLPQSVICNINSFHDLNKKINHFLKNQDNIDFDPFYAKAIQTFTKDTMTQETLNLYKEIINE